jgi:hypothetical protein
MNTTNVFVHIPKSYINLSHGTRFPGDNLMVIGFTSTYGISSYHHTTKSLWEGVFRFDTTSRLSGFFYGCSSYSGFFFFFLHTLVSSSSSFILWFLLLLPSYSGFFFFFLHTLVSSSSFILWFLLLLPV